MNVRSPAGFDVLIRFLYILVSSFAFLVVALLAAIAGYSLALPDFSFNYLFSHGLFLIGAYILLLWPYYASRHGLLERSLEHPDQRIDIDSIRFGIEYPAYIIILVAGMAFLIFGNYYFQPGYFGMLREIVLIFFLCVLPFFIVFAASLRNLASADTDKAFQFTERVLYPALCTGIVPFSVGWSIATGDIKLNIMIAGVAYVIMLIIFAKISTQRELVRVTGLIIFVVLLFAITMREELKVIILGTVILLAMGVSEASKRVYQAKAQDRYYPTSQGYEYYLAGSNWGSIVFLWLLSLVPLIIKELPTLPFLIFISLQSLIWFLSSDNFKWSKKASVMSLFFGYGLPIVIILTRAMKITPTFLPESIGPEQTLAVFGLIIAIGGLFLGPDFRDYLLSKRKFTISTYLSRKNNYYLFFLVLSVLMVITALIGTFSDNSLTRTKSAEIIGAGSIATLLLLILFFWQSQANGIAKENVTD